MSKKTKDTYDLLLEKAWGKFSKKDFDAALEIFDDILDKENKNQAAMLGRASVLLRTEDYEGALNDLNTLIEADNKNSKAFHTRAMVLGAQRQSDEALMDLQTASKLEPGNIEVWSDLGGTYLLIEDYSNASKCFDKCISLDKNCPLGWYGNGMLAMFKKDYSKAVESLSAAIKLDPKYLSALLARAEAYFELKKKDLALKDIKKILEIQPDIFQESIQGEEDDTDEDDYDSDENNPMDDDGEMDEY